MSLPLQPPPDESESLLLRDVLGTAAHDLGGLASALAMRAEIVPGDDGKALAAIASELRLLGRQLRQLRGSRDAELLAPSAAGDVSAIFVLVERFGRSALGRGFSLVVQSVDLTVSPSQGNALIYGLLAALRAIGDTIIPRPAQVDVIALPHEAAHLQVLVRVSGADGRTLPWPGRQLQGVLLAEQLLARAALTVIHHTEGMEIVVPGVAP